MKEIKVTLKNRPDARLLFEIADHTLPNFLSLLDTHQDIESFYVVREHDRKG